YLNLKPLQQHGEAFAGLYFGDESSLKTLGIRLVAGRNFSANDVTSNASSRPVIIVTRALASKLFPGGDALGKSVYLDGGGAPSTIIGIVDRLHVPSVHGQEASSPWYSVIAPAQLSSVSTLYAVRAKPDRLAVAMKAVEPALYAANPGRVMGDGSVKAFASVRADAYRADIGTAMLMAFVSVLLLAVTGAGVAGMSNAWVSERRKEIGIRRALGARKRDILRHFLLQNIAIVGTGAIIGACAAFGLNILLMSHFEMESLPVIYVLMGALIVIAVGQCAVLVPARRASNVPPAVATRSV
ncbi:MAG: ABC transporter permease, partial [Rhodanobacteraceae bacterium]